MGFNIVLLEPEIPNNTGNIGRLTLASGSSLHLIKPFGFELSDSRLKRAGLDYWKHVPISIYDTKNDFFTKNRGKEMVFLSVCGSKNYNSIPYKKDLFLIFGKESLGIDKELITQNQENVYKIPINNRYVRSLNLANAVSIVVFQGLNKLYCK
jgi:tRNA (cytidine/uridine-2'-O-)-methyltransferase